MSPEELHRLEELERQMREHAHNGFYGTEVDLRNIRNMVQTVTVAADLTKILAGKPTRFIDQFLIDTSTGTKKLYVYDGVGAVWRSTTIA